MLLLVHGGPGICDYLSDTAFARTFERRYCVVGFDQRGCRDSPSDGPFTVAANVADIDAIREHLDQDRITLMGHSWGGLLSVCFADAHPDRIAGMILVGSIGPKTGWEQGFRATIAARHDAAQRSQIQTIDHRIAQTDDPAIRERLYHERFNIALPSFLSLSHRDVPIEIPWFSRLVNVRTNGDAAQCVLTNRAFGKGLRAMHAPVAIIHGTDESIPWTAVYDLQSLMPSANVIRAEQCGHFPWLEDSQQWEAILSEAMSYLEA